MHFSSIYRQQPKITPRKWMSSVQLEKIEKEREALEKLKELAVQSEDVTVKRAAILIEKELGLPLHNSKDIEKPAYEAGFVQMPLNTEDTEQFVYYHNPTVAPWLLLIGAIMENRRYMNASVIPKVIYVSDELLYQLPRDMKICIEEDFNGKSIPFMQLTGEKVYIPIASAREAKGIILPKDTVWCAN